MRNVREEFWALRGPFDRSIKKDIKGVFKAKLPGKKKAYYYWEKIKGYKVKSGVNTFYLVYNHITKSWVTYEERTGRKIAESPYRNIRDAMTETKWVYEEATFPGLVESIEDCVKALDKGYKYQIG